MNKLIILITLFLIISCSTSKIQEELIIENVVTNATLFDQNYKANLGMKFYNVALID
tara:strand:- start:22556 stop:22726 length:171 start_codon:yes stop_codon:yes gene_type:complete